MDGIQYLLLVVIDYILVTFTFSLQSSSWVVWIHSLFSSEKTPLSYHIYENQHGQLHYNDITEDTSYELYNLTVCDIYTATVIAQRC